MAGKHHELMTRKTDRNALAGLLAEVAKQLGDPTPATSADHDSGQHAAESDDHHAGADAGSDNVPQG